MDEPVQNKPAESEQSYLPSKLLKIALPAGEYKLMHNEVGDRVTTDPKDAEIEMRKFAGEYKKKTNCSF